MNDRNWGGATFLSRKVQYQLQVLLMSCLFFPHLTSNILTLLLNDLYLTKGNGQTVLILLLHYLRMLLERSTADLNPVKI